MVSLLSQHVTGTAIFFYFFMQNAIKLSTHIHIHLSHIKALEKCKKNQ
jgi:hypothetical protein